MTTTTGETFREKLATALDERAKKVNLDEIIKAVTGDIMKNRNQLMEALTGCKSHFGGFEMDHCNGRMGAVDARLLSTLATVIDPIINDELLKYFGEAISDPNHTVRKSIRSALKGYASVDSYTVRQKLEKASAEVMDQLIENEKKRLYETLVGAAS